MSFINVGPNRAYTSINKGVSIADNGDSLLIDEGIYDEDVYIGYKHVNLIGNTQTPHHGKVQIRRLVAGTSNECLYVNGVSNKIFYFEGLNFVWSKADDAEANYSVMILFNNCNGSTMIFNKCIIDASFYFDYVFECNNELEKISLLNCRLNYKPITEFYGNNLYYFGRTSNDVMYDIRKCVTPYEFNNDYMAQPEALNGTHINTLLNATISGGWNNISNMFNNNSDTYCHLDDTVAGQPYYLYVEYNEPKIISRWMYFVYDYSLKYAGKIKLQASTDLVDWVDTPFSYVRDDHNEMEAFSTQLSTPYKYYRVEIIATTSYIRLYTLVFLEKGNDNFQFDCVVLPGKIGYGPAYGDYITTIPIQYIFKGTVSDNILNNVITDTVTWNPFDKANAVSLSNGDLRATVSTTNKYMDYGVRATIPRKVGKWYWEFKASSKYGLCRVGLGTYQASLNEALGYDSSGFGYEYSTGFIYHNGLVIAEGQVCVNDDVIGVAYNAYDGKIWFSHNGQWLFGGNPANNSNPIIEIQADLYPTASLKSSATSDAVVDLLINVTNLNYDIPEGYSFYGTNFIYKIKAINAITNVLEGWSYSSPLDSSYEVFTTYSGSHFLICTHADEDSIYNDLLLGRLTPEEFVLW